MMVSVQLFSFAACQRKGCVVVTIIDDEILENIEMFNFTLERTSELDASITLNPVDGVVQINDDDGTFNVCVYAMLCYFMYTDAVVGLEKIFYMVAESVGYVEVCVIIYQPDISCPISFPFNTRLSTIDDTAGMITLLNTSSTILLSLSK